MLNGYRTIAACMVIILVAVLSMFGVEVTLAERTGLTTQIVEIISALAAIYFRFTATKNLAWPNTELM